MVRTCTLCGMRFTPENSALSTPDKVAAWHRRRCRKTLFRFGLTQATSSPTAGPVHP